MRKKVSLNSRIFIHLAAVITGFTCKSQTAEFNMSLGGCQFFGGNIYCYGISEKKQGSVCIYKLDQKLKILDSIFIENPKQDLLPLTSDTLHNFLNIYLQPKGNKPVSILRLNQKNELVAKIRNVETARLNNTSMLGNDILYSANYVYAIKTIGDSSGVQFYLNKYELKTTTENFDYQFRWQFPFERKNIHSAKILFANKQFVCVFVNVASGGKAGQWILKIESASGRLIRGTRLGEATEANSFIAGNYFYDEGNKSIFLFGQKFSNTQYNLKENKFNPANAAQVILYVLQTDSTGEPVNRQEFKLPVKQAQNGTKKANAGAILRIRSVSKNSDGGFSLETDLYRNPANPTCYAYQNTQLIRLVRNEENLGVEKIEIASNPDIESYYFTNDKLDMNGKLCPDSSGSASTLFYRSPAFPVKMQFRLDEEKNPAWLLSKTSYKKNSINFSVLKPVKKIYQTSSLEEIPKSQNPVLIPLSPGTCIIGSQPENEKYMLKVYNW